MLCAWRGVPLLPPSLPPSVSPSLFPLPLYAAYILVFTLIFPILLRVSDFSFLNSVLCLPLFFRVLLLFPFRIISVPLFPLRFTSVRFLLLIPRSSSSTSFASPLQLSRLWCLQEMGQHNTDLYSISWQLSMFGFRPQIRTCSHFFTFCLLAPD